MTQKPLTLDDIQGSFRLLLRQSCGIVANRYVVESTMVQYVGYGDDEFKLSVVTMSLSAAVWSKF